jgi:hypothetical protein
MVIKMKEKKQKKQNTKKSLSGDSWNNSSQEGFMEMNQEDKEIYLFLRCQVGSVEREYNRHSDIHLRKKRGTCSEWIECTGCISKSNACNS